MALTIRQQLNLLSGDNRPMLGDDEVLYLGGLIADDTLTISGADYQKSDLTTFEPTLAQIREWAGLMAEACSARSVDQAPERSMMFRDRAAKLIRRGEGSIQAIKYREDD